MGFEELLVYQEAFSLAQDIFHISKGFPKEEMYNLTDQVRRSSRAVCACIGEGYRKRHYSSYFQSKLSDADMENSETQVWLQFCLECQYINNEIYTILKEKSMKIGRRLNHMIKNYAKFQ
jgi:four helix bundle protein